MKLHLLESEIMCFGVLELTPTVWKLTWKWETERYFQCLCKERLANI